MKELAKTVAAGYVAPKVLKNVKWSWLFYGAAAYFALRLLSKQGVKPAAQAVDFIDANVEKGIDYAKETLGSAVGQAQAVAKDAHIH